MQQFLPSDSLRFLTWCYPTAFSSFYTYVYCFISITLLPPPRSICLPFSPFLPRQDSQVKNSFVASRTGTAGTQHKYPADTLAYKKWNSRIHLVYSLGSFIYWTIRGGISIRAPPSQVHMRTAEYPARIKSVADCRPAHDPQPVAPAVGLMRGGWRTVLLGQFSLYHTPAGTSYAEYHEYCAHMYIHVTCKQAYPRSY